MSRPELATVEIRAFVPAREFALSMEFYQALGFTRASVFEDQPWAMRDFVRFDPSGVLWRIGQNLPRSVVGA